MIKYGTNNIGKIYFGSNPIGKAYLGSNLVFSRGSSPQPTTYVAYIRGGANGSYIDTGITADNTTRVIVWARNINPGSATLFGSRIGATDRTYGVFAPANQYTGSLRFDYGSTQNYVNDAFAKMSWYHKYELNGANFYIDDVLVGTATAGTFENSLNIYLFGVNTNHTLNGSTLPIDLCACKIYKNNVLVRDFTAVNSPSVGLYDSVSGTLFTNAGTGSFTYGTFNENAYTPLQYIQCSAAQGFDSGVKVSYSDIVVCKFMPTETSPRTYFLCSSQSQSATSMRAYIGNDTTLNFRFYIEEGSTTLYRLYNSTNPSLTDLEIIFTLQNDSAALYRNNALFGTQVTTDATSSFETSENLLLGSATDTYGPTYSFTGRFYYFNIGSKRSFVPAKVNNVAGMYDTYNDIFYPSVSGTAFIAGPEL